MFRSRLNFISEYLLNLPLLKVTIMLEITRIRNEKDRLIEDLKKRGQDFSSVINQISEFDEQWRSKKTELESLLAESNKISKEIGELFKSGKIDEANVAKNKVATFKAREQELKGEVDQLNDEIQRLLYDVPNVPQDIVPEGMTDQDNEVVEEI